MKHDSEFMERINRDLAARKAARRLLGVQENASEEQLKRAYREAAIAHHPDHKGNSTEANRRFALIKCAYELLACDKPCDELLETSHSLSDQNRDALLQLVCAIYVQWAKLPRPVQEVVAHWADLSSDVKKSVQRTAEHVLLDAK